MSTIALARSRPQALSLRLWQIPSVSRPQPFLAVLTWELRRYRASRRFWLQALSFFCLSFLLIWAQAMSFVYSSQNANGFIAGTSAWGLLMSLPTTVLLLVLFLPFVNADGVTRDLSRRTHELLMTTPLPSWAYVWGRYLIGLLISLGLAVLLLAAILGMGELLHLTNSIYPAPQVGTVFLLCGGIVVPATVLVSSLSFALCTLFPQQSVLVKIGILVAWVAGVEVLPLVILSSGQPGLSAWYSNWDPTSAATGLRMLTQFHLDANQITSAAQLQHLLNILANKVPDISAWLAPHLIESVLSFFLVVLAALVFRRFRSAFSAA